MVKELEVDVPGKPDSKETSVKRLRSAAGTTILVGLIAILAAGCAPKIAKPTPQQPGWSPPYAQGPVLEQELQALQANLKVVYFEYDRYALSPQAQADLQYNAEMLKRTPQGVVVVEGHCDERGTAEYNLALGDRRAKSVAEFLVGLGVPSNRLSTVSYGSELPVDPGHNEAAWAKNRRAYLRVSK